MLIGYNTNGYAHHRLNDAIAILAEQGYRGIALTVDIHHLDPLVESAVDRAEDLYSRFQSADLKYVIETGARYLLNPRKKHRPTLVDPEPSDRAKRFSFLVRCIEIAEVLGHAPVSFWSGSSQSKEPYDFVMRRLVEECKRLADIAAERKIRLAFEPEPGMFIDTMPKFQELHDKVNHPFFGLTLDVGHLVCMNEVPISNHMKEWKKSLWNIHLDDMNKAVHDHLMFGEGQVNFKECFETLKAIKFNGIASVELSRHSYDAVNTSRNSLAFLAQWL